MNNGQDHNCERYRNISGPVRMGFIANATFINRQVEFSVINELAVFEGDIILGRSEDIPATLPITTEGLVIVGAKYRWSNRTVPYVIDPTLPNPERVNQAADHWNNNTVLRFVPRTNEPDYIVFQWDAEGCYSYVGRQGGPQVIGLADWGTTGNAVHEMGHAIGLWHEQSREDRDSHVTIKWDNIQPSALHNFYQHIADGDDVGSYDYGSIMHYGPYGFAINPSLPTIESPQPIGQRERLSVGDVAAVAAMYL